MKKTIKVLFSIIFIIAILSICSKVNAATATLSATKTTATVGDSVTITVKYTAAAWNLSVSGDGISTTPYVGNTDDAKNATATKTITLNTSSAGTKTITLKGDVTDGDTDVTTKINTSVKITINEKTSTGGNSGGNTSGGSSNGGSSNTQTKATIKKLVVAGKTYNNPSKNITVKVDNDVTTAKISVTTSNGESFKINKGDNVKLEEGTNTVKITLASGNVYTVNIRRAAKEDDTPNIIDEPKPEEKVLLKSLKLQGVKLEEEKVELSYSPEFSGEVYEYSVNVASDITKIDVEAIASKEDYTVEITGNEELKEGENIITILVKAKDSDKVTTYKIKVIKEEAVEAVATLDETPTTGEELKDNNIIKIIIVIFTALVAIAGIVFAVIEYNYSKKHPKEKMGKIPYSNIGFKDEETDKEDILEEQEDKKEKNEKEESNAEESKPKKRGKHF